MIFVQFLKSLDELLFELVSWIVFFPVTLARVLRRPLAMMDHVEAELRKPADAQFTDLLSPPVFLVLAILIAHAAELALLGPDAVVTSNRGLAALVDDNTSLLLLRLVTFSVYPLVMAVNIVRKEERHLDRDALQGPFYAQCLMVGPLVLVLGAALVLIGLEPPLAKLAGLVVAAAAFASYGAVQTAWFARRLQRPLARGLLDASIAMIEALAAVALLALLFHA